jgi:putative oxidoreductase
MIWKIVETDRSFAPTLARFAAGSVMLAHGAQKMLGWFGGMGYEATYNGFTHHMGLPPLVANLVIFAEFFGALGLLFGFLTRFAALGITAVMVGAVAMVHARHGFFMNWMGNQGGEGYEFHVLMIGVMLALTWSGAGRWSVDRWLTKRLRRWRLERDTDHDLLARPSVA